MSNPLFFIFNTILSVVCALFAMRFILQATRADFYNPISQGILKFTEPALTPLRMLVPSYQNLDFAAFIFTWLLKILTVAILFYLGGVDIGSNVLLLFKIGLREVLELFLGIYLIALIIMVILSFLAPGNYHPVAVLAHQITEPVLAPVRRVIPPMGGLDFSVLVILMVIMLLRDYLLPGILPGI